MRPHQTPFTHRLSGIAAAVALALAGAAFAQTASQNPAQNGTRNPAENTVAPNKEMTTPAARTGADSSPSGNMVGKTGSSAPAKAATGASSAATSGGTGSDKASQLSSTDRGFVTKAAQIGMAEVQAGQLAKEKAASDQVKQFGDHMVTDHSKANDELKRIASGKQVDLPSAPSAKDQSEMKRLQSLSGVGFDRAYLDAQLAGHKEALKLFQTEAKSGRDPELKAFASSTVPTIQEHLKMATDAAKGSKSTGKQSATGAGSAQASTSR